MMDIWFLFSNLEHKTISRDWRTNYKNSSTHHFSTRGPLTGFIGHVLS